VVRRASGTALALFALACASSPASRPTPEQPLRVLVYNIHAGKDAKGVDNIARVAALVRDLGVDVALLQEVDVRTRRSAGVDQPATLARLTGFHAAFAKSLDYDGGEYGIAILSRWPISRDTVVRLPVEPPQERSGGSYEPRSAQRVVIASPLGPLQVINTHLDASGDDHWRKQEIRTVLGIAASARAGAAPLVLVGGDFNSTPESAVQGSVRAAGWTDAFVACGSGNGLTYPADSGTKRIDYLFLPSELRCASAEVPVTLASDHRPLLVVVRRG
jgi:endonuclease/exonuclease/phosphatase family metal-dependent hydrolase